MSLVPSKTFRENDELVSDLARFSEGILTEKQVRKKWHLFDESAWVAIGEDDLMVEMVEAEQVRRIPPGRGPGRPLGSKNKPKTIDEHEPRPRGVPGFDVG